MIALDLKRGTILYLQSLTIVVLAISISFLLGYLFFPTKISGSIIYDSNGEVRGSYLLYQNFQHDKYFKGRINSRSDNQCDVALYNKVFKETVNKRFIENQNGEDFSMMTKSSSLYDPYIKRSEALRQAIKVADARGVSVQTIIEIIDRHAMFASKPFFELDLVNVVRLNAYLEGI